MIQHIEPIGYVTLSFAAVFALTGALVPDAIAHLAALWWIAGGALYVGSLCLAVAVTWRRTLAAERARAAARLERVTRSPGADAWREEVA